VQGPGILPAEVLKQAAACINFDNLNFIISETTEAKI